MFDPPLQFVAPDDTLPIAAALTRINADDGPAVETPPQPSREARAVPTRLARALNGPGAGGQAAQHASACTSGVPVPKVIDGRQLQPPEPFERTLEALEGLAVGDEILLILNCQPQPLYRVLQRSGMTWREVPREDGSFEIHICHQATPT